MNEVCRLCRKPEDDNLISLFVHRNSQKVCEIVSQLFSELTIELNDSLPQMICDDCFEIASSACTLKRISLQSENYFRSELESLASAEVLMSVEVKLEDADENIVAPDRITVPTNSSASRKRKADTSLTEDEIKTNFTVIESPDLSWFSCNFCGSEFNSTDEMMAHMENSHNSNTKVCKIEIAADVDSDCGRVNNASFRVKTTAMVDVAETVRTQKYRPQLRPGQKPSKKEHIYYSCNFCHKKLRRTALLSHVRNKHDPDALPSPCRYCTERFVFEDDLKTHELRHKGCLPSILFCDFCGATGNRKKGMELHILDDHLDSSESCIKDSCFECTRCLSQFKNKRCLQDHVRRHHGDSFRCEQCPSFFANKKQLRQHLLIEHEKECRELPAVEVKHDKKCCACLDEFETDAELLNHLMTHQDNVERLLCEHNSAPKNFSEFIAHSKYHLLPKTHECLHCNKSFPFDNKFVIHLGGHKRSNVHRKIACPKCGSRFRSAKELETHDKVKHRNETLFICPFCAKSFCSKSSCDSHIKFVHKNEKKFECKVCKMRFNLKSHLSRHEATHLKERPCVCELCGNSFKTKEGLGFHMKRHNGTMKKFGCTQCSYKFVSKNRLQVHMLTHSGAKPYECEFCDRAYTSKGDLVKHLQKLHVGSAVYRCQKCPEAFPRIVELREHLIVHYEK